MPQSLHVKVKVHNRQTSQKRESYAGGKYNGITQFDQKRGRKSRRKQKILVYVCNNEADAES